MSAKANGNYKPRLLVLASTFPRWKNDPEPAFVFELARRLVDQFEVTVLCPHAAGAAELEYADEIKVIRYRYAPSLLETLVNNGGIVTNLRRAKWKFLLIPTFIISQLWWVWRLVRSGDIDIIHAHWILPQGLIAMLASATGRPQRVPFVVTSHGADLFALRSASLQWLKRLVLRRTAAITVVSEGMCAPVIALGADPSKLRIEPMGVDLSNRFTRDPAVERSEHELLFVGRLVAKKGLRHLIDALPKVIEQRPKTFLTVAGFGPELEARRAQAKQLGVGDRVRFLGAVQQDSLPALYRRASLFVAPFIEATGGDQDGLGLVLIEALGCGCPVVVSEMAATRGLANLLPGITVKSWCNSDELAELVIAQIGHAKIKSNDEINTFDWSSRAASYANLLLSAAGH